MHEFPGLVTDDVIDKNRMTFVKCVGTVVVPNGTYHLTCTLLKFCKLNSRHLLLYIGIGFPCGCDSVVTKYLMVATVHLAIAYL